MGADTAMTGGSGAARFAAGESAAGLRSPLASSFASAGAAGAGADLVASAAAAALVLSPRLRSRLWRLSSFESESWRCLGGVPLAGAGAWGAGDEPGDEEDVDGERVGE